MHYVRVLGVTPGELGLEAGAQLFVHLVDELDVSQAGSVGRYDDDRAEQTDLGVGKSEGINALGKVEHRVHEETRVATVVDGFALQYLAVQADHAAGLGVEQARQSHQQYLEHTRLKQRYLVFLVEVLEAGYQFGELDDSSYRGREPLREVLQELLLSGQWLWIWVQRTRLQQQAEVTVAISIDLVVEPPYFGPCAGKKGTIRTEKKVK